MSIEQTLQNIADALLKVAEANQAIAAASLKTEESYRASISAYAAVTAAGGPLAVSDTIEQDVAKVETDAKAAQQKAMDKVSTGKPSAAKETITTTLEAARAVHEALKEKPAAPVGKPEPEDDPLDAAPLDWDKDVRPALLAVGKDRDALVKLMGKYEVPKGGKAPAEKWADLLAEANAIVAARG